MKKSLTDIVGKNKTNQSNNNNNKTGRKDREKKGESLEKGAE